MSTKKHKRLAEGEVTGHTHTALADDAWVVGEGDKRVLTAPNGTEITHEEHKTVELPAGDYNISRQKEIDPDTEEIQVVTD